MSTRMYTSLCLVNVVILNSTCPYCNRLDPQIKTKGCVMQKLSQEHLTDGQITLINEGALLVLCSCIECGIPNQLHESTSVYLRIDLLSSCVKVMLETTSCS